MAENTRLKELAEGQRQLENSLKAEAINRASMEHKLADQFATQIAGLQQQFTLALAELKDHISHISSSSGSGEHSILGPGPGSGKSGTSLVHTPSPKLDFPVFDGTQVRSWILKCNTYFKIMPSISDVQRVHMASMYFEGKALSWFQNLNLEDYVLSWKQFVDLVSSRFEDLRTSNIIVEFNKLKQTGTYDAYVDRFDELRSCLLLEDSSKFTEEYFVASFLSGLSEDLQHFITMFQPQTLDQAIDLGRKQLLTLEAIAKRMKPAPRPYSSFPSQFRKSEPPQQPSPLPSKTTTSGVAKPVTKLLTAAEMAARRDKGLCYNCDEKYLPGHRCRARVFYLMMTEEEEALYSHDTQQQESELEVEVEEVQMSVNSMMGECGLTTMRVLGEVGDHKLNILLDTGSTLSFLQEQTACKLGCTIIDDKPLMVRVANGQKMFSSKRVKDFKWRVQGHEFNYSPRLLSNVGCDMILGGDWLRFCTPIELDYSHMTFTVTLKGDRIKLNAMTTILDCQMISGPVLSTLIHLEPHNIEEIFLVDSEDKVQSDPISTAPLPIQQVLLDFKDVFEEPVGLPPTRGVEHQITLKAGSVPRHQYPYRASHSHKDEIEKLVGDMLQSGIIQHSRSPFASPVILVKKKDNSWRMCVDYRYLNSLTIKHDFPIPIIDELLDELFGATCFSKIDLRSGYFQILMKPEDRYLTAFSTHHGHFEFLVMPFGLCNAPATFQSLMNNVFAAYLRKFVLVFFDDILVYSRCLEDHAVHLRTVLTLLRQHSLFAKLSKCSFGQSRVEYLGHVITAEGVSTDPSKVSCMVQWPTPKNLKQLRGFLGLTGYYRKFIRGYGLLSRPLTALLKKDAFHWSNEAESAFIQLKEAMVSAPVLALPNFTLPFTLETDASGKGVGAVLMQDGRPIAFMSKALGVKNQALSIYEREFLAVVMAVQRWRTYLQGHKFVIKTDQQSLKYLLDQKSMNPTQQRWLTKLLGLDYEIQFKSGADNKVADALSRSPDFYTDCSALTTVVPSWVQKVLNSYMQDEGIRKIFTAKAVDASSYPDYTISEGLLRYKNRVVVGNDQELRDSILHEIHSSPGGGHSGIQATYMRLKACFFWIGMKTAVLNWVKTCLICQRNKPLQGLVPGLLQPLPLPRGAWTHISMDFIDGLPNSAGKTVILVVIDRFTKYAHFMALSHPYTADSVAKVFLDCVYRLHGAPTSIVSDRDKVFTSSFWKALFKLMGTTLQFSSAYHPQTDGQTERLNQCLENYLRCMVSDCPKQWIKWLPLAEFWYNTTFHSSLKATPFQALYGYPPPSMSLDSYFSDEAGDAAHVMEERQNFLRRLQENLVQAQQRMKFFADLKRVDREFQVGDLVYVKLQPYRQSSLALRRNLKLSSRYYGPFKILDRIGKVAYKLDLPPTSKLHPVFHVSLLKQHVGKTEVPLSQLPEVDAAGLFVVRPATILGSRTLFRGGKSVVQWQIQWYPDTATGITWEDRSFLQKRLHLSDPWGQGSLSPGGIVMAQGKSSPEEGLESESLMETRGREVRKEVRVMSGGVYLIGVASEDRGAEAIACGAEAIASEDGAEAIASEDCGLKRSLGEAEAIAWGAEDVFCWMRF